MTLLGSHTTLERTSWKQQEFRIAPKRDGFANLEKSEGVLAR
jgi:hypothetical protein